MNDDGALSPSLRKNQSNHAVNVVLWEELLQQVGWALSKGGA